MPLNTKTIKRRIKSVGSTKKITKAMEMISAVKMRKAVANALASRDYAQLAWEMLNDVAAKTSIKRHPLLARRPVKRIGLILVTSNRGLAGGFSSRLLSEAHQYIKKEEAEVDIILLGRRGQKIYHRFGHSVAAEFEKIDLTARIEEVLPLARLVTSDYVSGKYDRIVMAYTDFVSPLKQVPRIKQLLPITSVVPIPDLQGRNPSDNRRDPFPAESAGRDNKSIVSFKFEPSPEAVLNTLLPRLVEMQIYQAILESDASEHSARMLAMANASDAADEMIGELRYSYNKARQAAITQEIAEIVGGAAALE